jgi:hypothetical protein
MKVPGLDHAAEQRVKSWFVDRSVSGGKAGECRIAGNPHNSMAQLGQASAKHRGLVPAADDGDA